MEPQTSKTGINILLILAIILISASIVVTATKKKTTVPVTTKDSAATTTAPVVSIQISTAPATTTDQTNSVMTSTSTATTSVALVNTTWTWVTTISQGKTISPKKQDAFTMMLTANGNVNGTTDCNKFSGTYKLSTTTITFGALASTKMFCEGSQELDFTSKLQGVKKYTVDKNNILSITDGTTTVTFK